jgi:hypothetical protein
MGELAPPFGVKGVALRQSVCASRRTSMRKNRSDAQH